MNLWVTLAQIFVYCTVHFKIESDGCLSLDIYLCGCVTLLLFIRAPTFFFFLCPCSQTETPHSFSLQLLRCFQVSSLRKLEVFYSHIMQLILESH